VLKTRKELRETATAGKHAISIGVFDGVHKGHLALVNKMLSEGNTRGLSGGVVTFYPHPVAVIRPDIEFTYLTSLQNRIELLQTVGVEFVSVLEFDEQLQRVSAKTFCEMLVEEAQMELLVVGKDFKLGRNGEGDIKILENIGLELGFEVISVPLVQESTSKVSSTRIREALNSGSMEEVGSLMGHRYQLDGTVILGDQRGRTIGFPTLNVDIEKDRLIPPNGVYITETFIKNEKYASVTNIGSRPTFTIDSKNHLETHLLDFNEDVYGEHATVEFISRLRNERKFNSGEELVQQIKNDVKNTVDHFTNRQAETS
jgi:riboflavin kinase/FMN adenylyltransferase